MESYIAKYTSLQWHEQTIISVYQNLEQLNQLDRNVVVIRLANELEDHLDFGVLYCRNAEHRLHYINRSGQMMVEMATLLGFPTLAAELEQVFQTMIATEIPPILQSDRDYSYVIPTSSDSQRLLGKWRYRLTQRLNQVRSVIKIISHE